MNTPTDRKRWSEDRRARGIEASTRQTWLNRVIRADVLDFAQNISYMDGMVLDELVVKATEDGWLAIVKAHRNGRRRVAYVGARTYAEAVELAADFAAKGVLTWQKAKRPPWTRQKRKP